LTYAEYLRTPHWRSLRAWAIERAGGKCQLCGSRKDLEVHHNCYDRLGAELPSDLVVLCDDCHTRHSAAMAPEPDCEVGSGCLPQAAGEAGCPRRIRRHQRRIPGE
jgi:5-methylcytosine-specific restriction endonuclease McrA